MAFLGIWFLSPSENFTPQRFSFDLKMKTQALTVTDKELQAQKDRHPALDDDAKAVAIEQKASMLYTKMFGQFDSRIDAPWTTLHQETTWLQAES